MSLAQYKDKDGETLYEKYPGIFDAEGLTNVGSCLANAHILGAAVKIPHIFARRNLRGNFEEIADYILNRVGAVGVVWGTYSQKALAIGTGLNRWGIPVILGPQGSKYRRLYLGRKDREKDWEIYNARTGERVIVDPTPGHLTYVAESKEEAIIAIARLVMRPNDTTKGRQIKLAHYIDLHKRYMGTMPEDLYLYVRTETDLPMTMKEEIKEILKEKGWKEKIIPDPTLVERLVWKKEEKK
jgi:acetyl-CoA decarbonylase/synthase complex subunit alpha